MTKSTGLPCHQRSLLQLNGYVTQTVIQTGEILHDFAVQSAGNSVVTRHPFFVCPRLVECQYAQAYSIRLQSDIAHTGQSAFSLQSFIEGSLPKQPLAKMQAKQIYVSACLVEYDGKDAPNCICQYDTLHIVYVLRLCCIQFRGALRCGANIRK